MTLTNNQELENCLWPGLGDLHGAPSEKCWAGFGFPLHDCPWLRQHHLVLLPPSGPVSWGIAKEIIEQSMKNMDFYPTMSM